MRIIAGHNRGIALASLGKGDASAHLRPTTDRVRESLFSILRGGRFGAPIEGARVLDLFAGTGALALEALSRGAASAVLVENGRVGQRLIAENIQRCKAEDTAHLLRRDARRIGPANAPANLIFLDPPYDKKLGEQALSAAMRGGWIAPEALIVWEERAEIVVPDGLALLDQRRFGDTQISFLRAV